MAVFDHFRTYRKTVMTKIRCCEFRPTPRPCRTSDGLPTMAFDKTRGSKAMPPSRPNFHESQNGRDQFAAGPIMVGG